jgi:hypothetical protein
MLSNAQLERKLMRTASMIVSICLVFGLSSGCSTAARADRPDAIAASLGYQGCRLSKPLTMSQVMAKDMSGGTEASRAHPDWDELISKYASGDQVYFVDCRKGDSSSIATGTSLYALVRNGVVITRVSDTAENR